MIVEDYRIFFELRKRYPNHCKLISELMNYAFQHHDSFDETTYINGNFKENDVKFIIEKLKLHIAVKKAIPTKLRSISYTIIEFL